MIKYKQIAHTAYKVTDMDKAINFYCNGLGLKYKYKIEDKREPDAAKRMYLVYLEIVPGQFIELFTGTDGLPESDKSDNHFGYVHLSLEVEDIKKAKSELLSKGITITADINLGVDHTYQMWIADPDGNRIELMEYTKDSMQLQ